MANEYYTTDKDLQYIADAIRIKGGTTALLSFPSGYVSAIQNIQYNPYIPGLPSGTYTVDSTVYNFPEIMSVSGCYTLTDEGDGNWTMQFYQSGVINFSTLPCGGIDIFVVGGGGAGCSNSSSHGNVYTAGGGGGGGFTATLYGHKIYTGNNYTFTVGAGGAATTSTERGGRGGTTNCRGLRGLGGYGGLASTGTVASHLAMGGIGGSGGGMGGSGYNKVVAGAGGTNGGDGGYTSPGLAAIGQKASTKPFRAGTAFAGGGGGGSGVYSDGTYIGNGAGGAGGGGAGGKSGHRNGYAGTAGTGGGGGGCAGRTDSLGSATGGKGGSGTIIIRNMRN